MNKWLGLIILCFSSVTCAVQPSYVEKEYGLALACNIEGLQLKISKRGHTVPEKINLRSALGAKGAFDNELSFKIIDANGVKYDYLPQQRLSRSDSDYFTMMHPNRSFGILVSFDDFNYSYQLKPSSYSVQAFYKNLLPTDIGKYNEPELNSNIIEVIVDEKGYRCGRTAINP